MKVFNFQMNAAAVALLVVSVAGPVFGQTLLSQYKFDGDLTNSSTFMDTNGTLAPDGTYRTGTDSATAAAGTPTFTTGVDGTPNGAIVFDGNSGEGGSNGWVDVTTAGHPGAPIGLQGTPTDDDPFASNGPGLVSGTAMAWVKSTNTAGARWIMGNLNANPSPPFVFDTQAWLMGWSGSRLQAFPRASGPGSSGVQRFIVSDPTETTDWADDEWHHVAFRWNGGAEQGNGTPEYAAVFLDGVNLGATATNFFLDPTDTQNAWQFPMAIGARNNRGTLDGFFDGAIDDLRIYSDFLSDQEILDIFNEVSVGSENADFDGDTDIDGTDLLTWQEGFGVGTTLAEGDANGSGGVDGDDLAIWNSQYGTTPSTIASQSVPEPTAILLALSGMLCMVSRHR